MATDNAEVVERWGAITHRYTRFMVEASWDHLNPMLELSRWVAEQPFAAKLFPHTSMTALCVGLRAGYNPDHPFFSVELTEKGQIEFQLWAAVGKHKFSTECEVRQVNDLFKEFVGWLDVATDTTSARSSWLTSDVVALAEGIYQERAFDRLPILADALQDAGCDNDDILNHCRQPCEHCRRCWVVDLLTGRK